FYYRRSKEETDPNRFERGGELWDDGFLIVFLQGLPTKSVLFRGKGSIATQPIAACYRVGKGNPLQYVEPHNWDQEDLLGYTRERCEEALEALSKQITDSGGKLPEAVGKKGAGSTKTKKGKSKRLVNDD